jgi:hypothetical protein
LVLRETLLGALKARLENDKLLKIHASDFHTAVEQLGLNFGSRVSNWGAWVGGWGVLVVLGLRVKGEEGVEGSAACWGFGFRGGRGQRQRQHNFLTTTIFSPPQFSHHHTSGR